MRYVSNYLYLWLYKLGLKLCICRAEFVINKKVTYVVSVTFGELCAVQDIVLHGFYMISQDYYVCLTCWGGQAFYDA